MRTSPSYRPTPALLLTILLAIAFATGCGGSSGPAIEIPADPAAASDAQLESLYSEIALQLQSARPGSDAATRLEAQRATVGGELAERAAAAVRTRLSQTGRVDGLVPMGALQREIAGLDAVGRWSKDVESDLRQELEKEVDRTRQAMASRDARLDATPIEDVLGRLELLSELSVLSGTGSEEQARYAEQRDALLREVSAEAQEAIQNEDYEKAQGLLGIVQEVNPDDEAARQQKCEVDGKVILKRFAESLETGRVTGSVDMLTEFAETDCFADIKDGLAESAAPMAEAFAMLGQEATSANDMNVAYQRYRDSRTISTLLLDEKNKLPGIDAFMAKLDAAYEKAFDAGEFGVAWGYLNVMTEFTPMTPRIRQNMRITRDELRRRAVRGLTAYPFEEPRNAATDVGDAVASKVVQHIFKTIPSDVRIVEREQLERILDECERSGDCDELDTADFIVQGNILDAKVETTEKVGNETRRVVTGKETVTNPEHTRWAQLADRERKNTTEPPRTVTRDVTEDVTIRVTSVRKVGIISVSYRVVEASSGRVLFTDSIQTKQSYQDEGRQGVQLGDFKQETDFVELPPDIEILSGQDGLADKISLEIGTKLVDFLKDPEEQYAIDAARFVQEGDYFSAARNAAYAIVLREIKSKDLGTLREDLKSYAMASPRI